MRLIDEEALREEFLKNKPYAIDFLSLIDNAPTFDCMHCDDFYEIEDCQNCPIANIQIKEMSERPQGER